MNIPNLGSTAEEIIEAAIKYPRAGYPLYFHTVGNGSYFYSEKNNLFYKKDSPLTSEIMRETFEGEELTRWIELGEVSIIVESPSEHGPNWELHRATGLKLNK